MYSLKQVHLAGLLAEQRRSATERDKANQERESAETTAEHFFRLLQECVTPEAKINCLSSVELRARLQTINQLSRMAAQSQAAVISYDI